MGAKTKTVTDATFADDVLSDKPVIVDFWAEWCGRARWSSPILERSPPSTPTRSRRQAERRREPRDLGRPRIMSIPTLNVYRAARS